MIKSLIHSLSHLFDKKAEQAQATAAAEEVIHSSVTPQAFSSGSGSVVILPPRAYEATELSNLIVAGGGKEDSPAYWRIICDARAWDAQQNGTDRNSNSKVHTLRGDNVTMSEHGVHDPAQVTYLHRMGKDIPAPAPGTSVLVYRDNGIRNITTNNPSVPFPNTSFYMFTQNAREALLAVITSAPMTEPEHKQAAEPQMPSPSQRHFNFP